MQRRIISSHVLERGFTIVELVLVIGILGILIAIAVSSVSGYQSQARDRERKADVFVITQNLERYYRTQAVVVGPTYPATSVGTSVLTTIIDDTEATSAPNQIVSSLVIASNNSSQTPTISQYTYQPLNVNGTLCTAVPCAKYKIFYRLEKSSDILVKDSLRQQ